MARGGRRNGAGRKAGGHNQVSVQARDDLWAYIHQHCAVGQQANPYEVMVTMMIRTEDDRLKLQCAKELATYLLPKLSSVQLHGDADHPLTIYHVELE